MAGNGIIVLCDFDGLFVLYGDFFVGDIRSIKN